MRFGPRETETAKERKNRMCENISDYTSLNILTLGFAPSMFVSSY